MALYSIFTLPPRLTEQVFDRCENNLPTCTCNADGLTCRIFPSCTAPSTIWTVAVAVEGVPVVVVVVGRPPCRRASNADEHDTVDLGAVELGAVDGADRFLLAS